MISGFSSSYSISARPAHYGVRRVAPVASILRVQSGRPRPARYIADKVENPAPVVPVEPVVVPQVAAVQIQLLVRDDGETPADPQTAVARYLAADDLDQEPQSIAIATL